jgi:oxygen-independent coproporphyrinogen-3 oxidase
VDPSFRNTLEHIVKLFFAEIRVQFDFDRAEAESPADLAVRFELGERAGAVRAVLTAGDREFRYDCPLSLIFENDALKRVKKAASHCLLQVLEQYTGIDQPWGILTGVRPAKLFHSKLRNGLELAAVRKQFSAQLLVREEKIALLEEIVKNQLRAVPDLYNLSEEVSIYIGVPFCPTKCAYCTFPAYAIQGRQSTVNLFLEGLHYEIGRVGRWLKDNGIRVTSVYFGGGTPTSITAEEMDRLYDCVFRSFPEPDRIREITVEAGRPDTITAEKLAVLKAWNIDRISINPQSYTQETLRAIGRHHTVEETIEKFHLARAHGMNNINMDLIIGLPGEGLAHMLHSLAETEKLMPESLTVHTLSFKRASEMTQNKEKYQVAERGEIKRMMAAASEWTRKNNYVPYYLYRQKNILGNLENIGYAQPGKESVYNIMIMEEAQTIIGLGSGAASKLVDAGSGRISRLANPKDPKSYIDAVRQFTDVKIQSLNALFHGGGVNAKPQSCSAESY